MTRKTNQPEDLWSDATYEQLADLREWIQSRMKRRHADSISAWLLSLGTDQPATPHKRQLAFFRRILDGYGPPRPAADAADPPRSASPPEAEPAAETEGSSEPDGNNPEATQEDSTSEHAGRFHRA